MNKKIVHDAFILTAFTLVLGLLLGIVYGITKDPIALADEEKTLKAYQMVFADAENFEAYEEFDEAEAATLMEENGYSDEILDVQVAYDKNENAIGYVITVIAKDASQANITFSVGIRQDGTVNGYSITSISETPGLGDKAKSDEFASQYADKKVSSFTVVKQAPASDEEIEAISGATITSKAMTNGVNACLTYYQKILGGDGNE